MPSILHNLIVFIAGKIPLPNPLSLGLEKNIVVRQRPSPKQINKGLITISEHQGQTIYTFGEAENGKPILYYCHGGGFVTGMFSAYFDAIARLSRHLGISIICPDYPMPPETDAQGVIDFTLSHFKAVREKFPDSPIIISGDSAGGHLTLTLTQALNASERKAVKAIFPLFPVVDMRQPASNPIFHKEEILLSPDIMNAVGERFMGDFKAENPIISPICGKLTDLPTVHIYSADKDLLYENAVALEAALKECGQAHSHHVFNGYGHDFVLFFPTPDSRRGLKRIADHMLQTLS